MKRKRKPKAAASKDILSNKAEYIRPKWRQHYRRLAELRDQFHAQRRALVQDAKEEQAAYSQHMADAGTDAYDRDWALSMLSQEQNALYEIEEAMNRIKKGLYGICELTGKPIEPARLEAIPWTRFTAKAERELEEQGKIKRARLGERGSVFEPAQATEMETG